MKHLSLLVLLISSFSFAQETSKFFDASDIFFKQYVSNGKVKYAEIKQNPNDLYELLSLAKRVKVSTEDPEVYKAFWINTYNIAVISGIIKQFPVKSPMDIEGFFNVKTHSLGQKSVTWMILRRNSYLEITQKNPDFILYWYVQLKDVLQ